MCLWEGEAGGGILGVGQPRGVMGGTGAGCSSRTASNYIQGVKPSITPPISLSVILLQLQMLRHFAGNTFPVRQSALQGP